MNTLLVAVNCKYVHTNLALRYLKKCTANVCDTAILEFSINDHPINIEREIVARSPDVVAFSCYIWNIDFVLNLCSDIKKALPGVKIILGGPEVTFDSADVLYNNSHYYIYSVFQTSFQTAYDVHTESYWHSLLPHQTDNP